MNDDFFQLVPARLAEERQRLKLTQAQAAKLCGVSRDVWGKYERGETAPGSQVLFGFWPAGADVSYILTGVRAAPIASDQREALDDDRDRLALAIEAVEEGLQLIKRKLPPDKKAQLILAAFDLLAEPESAKSKVIQLIRLVA